MTAPAPWPTRNRPTRRVISEEIVNVAAPAGTTVTLADVRALVQESAGLGGDAILLIAGISPSDASGEQCTATAISFRARTAPA